MKFYFKKFHLPPDYFLQVIFQELEERLSGLSEQTDSVYDPEDIADPVIETKEEKSEREALYNTDNNDYQPTEEDDLNQFPHIRK